MTDEEKRFDRREEARLDDMYDAQSEPEEEEDEMKPTQEQVIAWAREAGIEFSHHLNQFNTPFCDGVHMDEFEIVIALAYEAGRKDENEACAKFCQQAVEESEKTNAELSTTEILEKAVISGAIHQARRIDAAIRARREQ